MSDKPKTFKEWLKSIHPDYPKYTLEDIFERQQIFVAEIAWNAAIESLQSELDKRDALLEKAKLLIESYKLILKAFDGPDAILALYCSDNCENNVALIKSKCDEFLKELTQGNKDE